MYTTFSVEKNMAKMAKNIAKRKFRPKGEIFVQSGHPVFAKIDDRKRKENDRYLASDYA
jgi:hypothetical protein